jgi:hypothetical protein
MRQPVDRRLVWYFMSINGPGRVKTQYLVYLHNGRGVR